MIVQWQVLNTKVQTKMYIRVLLNISLIYLIIILVTNSVTSEWIDLPQFSDEFKIYRVPFIKSNRHKIMFDRSVNIIKNTLMNSTDNIIDEPKTMIPVPVLTVNTEINTLTSAVVSTNDEMEVYTTMGEISKTVSIDSSSNNSNVNRQLIMPISETFADDCSTDKNENFPDDTTTIERYKVTVFKSESLNSKGQFTFLQNLPLELIKRVHKILLGITQTTVSAKQNFLKAFEKSILRKLESRLTPIFNSVRKKRGSGWDDRDDYIGFPSLEGGLLAISFLTFAVYLVQLVMMLLKNLGNNANNPGTVVVNRNKRSTFQMPEDYERVLEYLDQFSNN